MVTAYLRGLLKPDYKHGFRSMFTEDVILESVAADELASNMLSSVKLDSALFPVLTEKGIRQTAQTAAARLTRISELRTSDIYRVADQIAGKLKLANPQNEMSLYQLYQIAEKQGIFDAFDEQDEKLVWTPLL